MTGRGTWLIGVRTRREQPIWEAECNTFTWQRPPRGLNYADPFPVERGGRTWLFWEVFSDGQFDGVIACAELWSAHDMTEPEIVLRTSHHMSFPNVFEHGTDMFMLPETRRAGAIQLYVATRFPFEWKLHRTLVADIEAVDPTLTQVGDTWYLIAGIPQPPGVPLRLAAFVSKHVDGPYVPHPCNYLPTEPLLSRAAGRLFQSPFGLVRPSQDCRDGYGRAIVFNRVHTLTECEYREERFARLAPPSEMAWGLHTYTFCDSFETIDLFVESADDDEHEPTKDEDTSPSGGAT